MGGWKLKPKIASTINSQFSFPFSSTKLSKESLMGMLNVLHCLTNACKNDINQLEREFFKKEVRLGTKVSQAALGKKYKVRNQNVSSVSQ